MGSYKSFLNIGEKNLNSLTRKELAPIISTLKAVANKRFDRFEKQGLSSPALLNRSKYTNIKGKNLNELRALYSDLNDFLQYKTSTVKGYKEYSQEVYKRISGSDTLPSSEELQQFLDTQSKDFWKAYNRAKDMGIAHGSNSDIVQKSIMAKMKDKPNASPMDIIDDLDLDDINRKWLEDYEKREEEFNRNNQATSFFEFDL